MNSNSRIIAILLGIAVLFAVLTVSTVSAYDHDQTYNANATYFVPENITLPGHCSSQEVGIWVNSSVVIKTAEIVFNYTYCCANATDYTPDPQWNLFNDWNPKPYGEFGAVRICAAVLFGLGPGPVHIGNITLHCCNESYCETDLTWDRDTHATYFEDAGFVKIHIDTYGDGTFTCGEALPPQTFEKELIKGWNLISLPLTASDMTVASVFSSVEGSYSAIYRYDNDTKHFVVLSGTDELENGVGYFIRMTSADTWTYQGTAYTNMAVSLKQGLNMIGWLNCTRDINDALSSIAGKYRYAARWNATAEKFEVYVPNAPSAFNDFNTMEQGRGYFISMKQVATLSESC